MTTFNQAIILMSSPKHINWNFHVEKRSS